MNTPSQKSARGSFQVGRAPPRVLHSAPTVVVMGSKNEHKPRDGAQRLYDAT
jgi:hypothetical protein